MLVYRNFNDVFGNLLFKLFMCGKESSMWAIVVYGDFKMLCIVYYSICVLFIRRGEQGKVEDIGCNSQIDFFVIGLFCQCLVIFYFIGMVWILQQYIEDFIC